MSNPPSGPQPAGRTPGRSPGEAVPQNSGIVIANGKQVAGKLPCSIEEFLAAQNFLPRSVVVEHNGEAVAPSEFSRRLLQSGDRLEVVTIVAGG